MKLIECPLCKHQISDEAQTCPSCGHGLKSSSREKDSGIGCGPIILLTVLGLIVTAILTAGGNDIHKECRSDFYKCKDNGELVEYYQPPNHRSLSIECKFAAIKIAIYGEPEFSSIPFASFYKGDFYKKDLVATLIDDDVKFSNGFGAKVNSKVICDYDLISNKASVSAMQR